MLMHGLAKFKFRRYLINIHIFVHTVTQLVEALR